jgi:hypothetical protein
VSFTRRVPEDSVYSVPHCSAAGMRCVCMCVCVYVCVCVCVFLGGRGPDDIFGSLRSWFSSSATTALSVSVYQPVTQPMDIRISLSLSLSLSQGLSSTWLTGRQARWCGVGTTAASWVTSWFWTTWSATAPIDAQSRVEPCRVSWGSKIKNMSEY